MQRPGFVRYYLLGLVLALLNWKIYSVRYYFYRHKTFVLYSNESNENFLTNSPYFLFFENLKFLSFTCNINCPYYQYIGNQILKLDFQTRNCKFQEDTSITVFMQMVNITMSTLIKITFKDKLEDVILTCPSEDYFTIDDIGYALISTFKWSNLQKCIGIRDQLYATKFKLWDDDNKIFIQDLPPQRNKFIYHIIQYLYVYIRNANRLVGHLYRPIKVYLIDGSNFICNNHTGRGILVNTQEPFVLKCNLASAIPFLDYMIKLQFIGNFYYEWYMEYEFNFNSDFFAKPKALTYKPVIDFASQRSSYTLKEIVLFLYVKVPGLCNESEVYVVNTLENFTCFNRYPHPTEFYIKIQNISNQINESIKTNILSFHVLKTWIPEVVSKLTGKMYINDMGTNVLESERQIMDFKMFIKKSVIRNMKILPDTMSINLPDTIMVKCQSGGVPVVLYFWVGKKINQTVYGCSLSFYLPQINFTAITVSVAIQYEFYWYNSSKVYLIGRIPSIVIITSKFPKLAQSVMCYTDGENGLYNFKWICNESNEPKDLVPVNYITSVFNDLIFHETAPLISYNCVCLSTYRDLFGREIFAISADVELNLAANEMIDCELAKSAMDKTTWTIFVIYILIFFMIPSIFFLIAYFVTDGRIKSVIQSKILNKLGFINKQHVASETIPCFIIAKSDVGEIAFNHFFKRIFELDKTLEALRLFREMSFPFSKQFSDDSEERIYNLNQARKTLFQLMERHENKYKSKYSQFGTTKLESFTSNHISSLKTLSEDKQFRDINHQFSSKLDYLSNFRKINKHGLTNKKNHKITFGIKVKEMPFINHDILTQPRVRRNGLTEIHSNTTIRHLKQIIKEIPERENVFSIGNASDIITFQRQTTAIKPEKQIQRLRSVSMDRFKV